MTLNPDPTVTGQLSPDNTMSSPPPVTPKTMDPDFYIESVFVVFEVSIVTGVENTTYRLTRMVY
jgi:hypothetical protein